MKMYIMFHPYGFLWKDGFCYNHAIPTGLKKMP